MEASYLLFDVDPPKETMFCESIPQKYDYQYHRFLESPRQPSVATTKVRLDNVRAAKLLNRINFISGAGER